MLRNIKIHLLAIKAKRLGLPQYNIDYCVNVLKNSDNFKLEYKYARKYLKDAVLRSKQI